MYGYFGFGKTHWESSYFGGVKRVLIEYPFYALNYDLDAYFIKDCKVDKDLTIYQKDKLINIFVSEAIKNLTIKAHLTVTLKNEYERTLKDKDLLAERTKMPMYGFGKPKIQIPISVDTLTYLLQIAKDTELKAIFEEYGNDILNAKVVANFDIPDNVQALTGDRDALENKVHEDVKKFIGKFKTGKGVESLEVSVQNIEKTEVPLRKICSDSVTFAKKLYQMLDIIQDPKEDVVKNLLQGKVDSEKLAEVLSGNNRVHMRKVENISTKPFKVIVLADYSGSMKYSSGKGNKVAFQQNMLQSLFYLFHDLLKIEDLEIYGHSGDEYPILYRHHSPEYPHFMETYHADIDFEENYDGPVIEHLHTMTRAKTSKAVLLITLSDGQPSGQNYGGNEANAKMKQVLEKIKRDNFVTVGIGMLYTAKKDLYQYTTTLTDLNNASAVAQIINRAVKENLVIED